MSNIAKGLNRLEDLNEKMRNPETSLEDALAIFEEGITLARSLEKALEKIEGKIEILKNSGSIPQEKPELDLFTHIDDDQ